MLQFKTLCSFSLNVLPSQLAFLQNPRLYSTFGTQEEDFAAARQWYRNFTKNTIPESISKTSYSRASGAGGQKVNKTSSKASTIWAASALEKHVPKVVLQELKNGRFYVASSDAIAIHCDSNRSQGENKSETHQRLNDEIKKIYKNTVPGVTPPAQKAKIESLTKRIMENYATESRKMRGDKNLPEVLEMATQGTKRKDWKKKENTLRLKQKKQHSDKKSARKSTF